MAGTLTSGARVGGGTSLTVGTTEMVADSLDIYTASYGTGDWHYNTGIPDDAGNWYYTYPEPQKSEVTVHYDLHYDAPKKEVKEEMAGLYRVIAVDYKNRKVVVDEEVITNSEKAAELKVLAGVVNDYDLDDLDIKTVKVMDVRKVPEPQKVQVVEE
jgi:hypothetical protein